MANQWANNMDNEIETGYIGLVTGVSGNKGIFYIGIIFPYSQLKTST